MNKSINRKEILERLHKTINEKKPILVSTCGNGLIAKCAEIGGTDLILIAGSSKSRLMGLPTTPMGYINDDIMALYKEISNVVRDTPIIAGLDALDPTRMDLDVLLKEVVSVGYVGVLNFPSLSPLIGHERRLVRESVGLGFEREVEMMRLAKARDLFTMAYAYNPGDAKCMAEAHVDVLVAHVGMTKGGLVGSRAATLEKAATFAQEIIDVVKSVDSQIICLSHGGPFSSPESTKYLYKHTEALGFVGASSIERIPIEKAIIDIVTQFKSVPIADADK